MTASTYTINGFTIQSVKPISSNEVRFMSQRNLFALATPEASAELRRRASIINAR